MSADNWTECPSCKTKDVFREDYEIGVYMGEFYVSYTGQCTVKDCEFTHNFKHEDALSDLPTNSEDGSNGCP